MRAAAIAILATLMSLPAAAQFFGGGGSSARVTWVLCNAKPCVVGDNLTNAFVVTDVASVMRCYIQAKTAPAGASLILRVKKSGVSISGATPLTLPAGQNGPVKISFATAKLVELDTLTVDIVQVGSTTAGQDVTLVCRLE